MQSNISYLKGIIIYTRLEVNKKYEFKTSEMHPYTKYYTYFLTSSIRFEFKDKDSKYFLNEDESVYFTEILNFSNKYLDILEKYDSIKKYVSEDKWLDFIFDIDKISF